MAKKENHYVDNDRFREELMAYKRLLEIDSDARVPEYIGECILEIATRFARKPNFAGYSYKEEMISDGIENCFQYLQNYSDAKSLNPFAYFTQIIYFAFCRRIMSEKKQSYIKHRLVMEMPMEAFTQQSGDDSDMMEHHLNALQSNSTFDGQAFEDSLSKRKMSTKKTVPLTPLEDMMEN